MSRYEIRPWHQVGVLFSIAETMFSKSISDLCDISFSRASLTPKALDPFHFYFYLFLREERAVPDSEQN